MTRGRTVLVVDDDEDVRDSVAFALEDHGYLVVLAGNGRVALRMLLDDVRPDLILLDMMMPEMDGWTFRAEQRKHPAIASIPVLVFTAFAVPATTVQDLGALGFLKKPLRLTELLATVASALAPM